MSQPDREPSRITAEVALGVEVRILDSRLKVVAGAEDLSRSGMEISKALPPGIYTVRWSAGVSAAQSVVRLRAGDHLKLPLSSLIPGAAPSDDVDLASRQFDVLCKEVRTVRDATLTVFVCANDTRTTSDVGANVEVRQLHDGVRSVRRTVEAKHRNVESVDGWSVAHHDCEPGLYVLRYLSFDRLTIEQTLFLPRGRQTVVWLRYGSALNAEKREGDTRLRARRGVDPARTRIISVASDRSSRSLRQKFLLCDHLLSALNDRHGSVGLGSVKGLEQEADPFLKLFGAAALMARPSVPAGNWREDPANPMAAPALHVSGAEQLISDLLLSDARDWPDVVSVDWRIALANGSVKSAFEGIYAPPMLEIAWRWASAWSVQHPSSVDPTRDTLAAVARGQERTTPWLSWRASDLRTKGLETTESSSNLSDLGLSVIGEISAQISVAASARTLDLSETTRSLLESASRVASQEIWSNAGKQLLSRLAGATGLPVATLVEAANAALSEVRSAVSSEKQSDNLTNDPNKGAFGGKAKRDRFSVSLESFEQTNSKEFLALRIRVRGSKANPVVGPVHLYLHPTFSPPTQVIAPVDGVATHVCYAWGAFTLGVELANGVRLELDLADDERLPKWFRSR